MIQKNGSTHGHVINNMHNPHNTICPECQGGIEEKKITHDLRFQGSLYSFQEVPARVCSSCGSVYLDADVLKQIESVFKKHIKSDNFQKVPLFSFNNLAVA